MSWIKLPLTSSLLPMPKQPGDLEKLRWRCALGCNADFDAPDSPCPRIYTKHNDISGVQKHVGEFTHFEKYYEKCPLPTADKLRFIKGVLGDMVQFQDTKKGTQEQKEETAKCHAVISDMVAKIEEGGENQPPLDGRYGAHYFAFAWSMGSYAPRERFCASRPAMKSSSAKSAGRSQGKSQGQSNARSVEVAPFSGSNISATGRIGSLLMKVGQRRAEQPAAESLQNPRC